MAELFGRVVEAAFLQCVQNPNVTVREPKLMTQGERRPTRYDTVECAENWS